MRGPVEAAAIEGTACRERPHLAQRVWTARPSGLEAGAHCSEGGHKDTGRNNTRERKLRYCPGWQSADTQLWHG